jgi:hypothetical protein
MLRRLAAVIWWFGSIVWIGTAFGCLYKQTSQLIERHGCAPIFTEYATWQQKTEDFKATYEAHRKKVQGNKPIDRSIDPEIAAAFAQTKSDKPKAGDPDSDATDSFDELVAVEKAAPMPTGLDKALERCEATEHKTYWLVLVGASVFTLIAFSLAFVFGGQFWLPPKSPTN